MRGTYCLGLVPILFVLAIAGCSTQPAQQPYEPPTPAPTASASGVAFSGPWSSALAETYRTLKSPDLRAAVADGEISDADVAAAEASVIACLAKDRIAGGYDQNGNISFAKGTDSDDQKVDECVNRKGGTIVSLRRAMDRNPKNRDDTTIIFECIQRAGIVESSYSLTAFNEDSRDGSFPFDPDAPAFTKCLDDPLNSYLK